MAPLVLVVLLSGLGPSADPAEAQLRRLLELRAPDSLKDFRLPEPADLTGDWAAHPRSFLVQADFDGDSRTDTAVLLIRRSGPGFRLLVVFGKGGAAVLEDQVWPAQGFGLSVARPGRYRTAAGKGYDLGPNNHDPPEVQVTLPAIERYHFESWSALWYWDRGANRFQYIQLSD